MPKPGPRTTYRYSEEFKAGAVRLSLAPGVADGDVARSLYIPPFMLSRWRRQAREGRLMVKNAAVDAAAAAAIGQPATSCNIDFYNHQRLHSALGYRSPVEFERHQP